MRGMKLPVALGMLLPAALAASQVAGTIDAHAAGPVASYVLAPSPIAAAHSLGAGATVVVTLTAQDATAVPVPGATVFIGFNPTTGGGTALVGNTTPLTTAAKPFMTDGSGHVSISYHTPSTLPATGHDTIKAETATGKSATIKAHDDYDYSTVTSYKFKSKPIATTATLAPNQVVTVTVTAHSSAGGVGGAVVYLTFVPGAGGGSAAVGSTALTATRHTFTANSVGVVTITYKAPGVLPAHGVIDTLKAENAASGSNVIGMDTYTF
jgi:hypothetical protein